MPEPKKEKAIGKKKAYSTSFFPPELKDEIDRLIVRGNKFTEILKQVRLQFPDVEFPSDQTWKDFCAKRSTAIKQNDDIRASLEFLSREVNLLKVDTSNPEAVLHAVFEQSVQQIEEIKRENAQVKDVMRSRLIVEHLKVLNEGINTKLKMDNQGYFIEQKLQEMAKVLSNQLYKAFVQAYKEVHGDSRFAEFDKALSKIMGPSYWETLESQMGQVLIPERTGG